MQYAYQAIVFIAPEFSFGRRQNAFSTVRNLPFALQNPCNRNNPLA
jgi:hypothetical protein